MFNGSDRSMGFANARKRRFRRLLPTSNTFAGVAAFMTALPRQPDSLMVLLRARNSVSGYEKPHTSIYSAQVTKQHCQIGYPAFPTPSSSSQRTVLSQLQ